MTLAGVSEDSENHPEFGVDSFSKQTQHEFDPSFS